MTYTERSHEVALHSSISVLVLLSHDYTDVEFWPLGFGESDRTSQAEFTARRLRSVGVMGLGPGLRPLAALKEDLPSSVIDNIASSFLRYIQVLLSGNFAEHLERAETAELERLYSLPDYRS